jgi:DNA-binding PadR family transcriptional regulator
MHSSEGSLVYSIEYSLLGLLCERPMHGYELHQELSRKMGLGLIWTVKQGQLYAILAKLESGGLIAAEVLVQGNRPARRVFHPTEEGIKAFQDWVGVPSSRRAFRLDFLAKLFFAHRNGPEEAGFLLSKQRALCASWIGEMEVRAGATEGGGMDALVYRYRIGQLTAMLAWLDDCKDYFKRSP